MRLYSTKSQSETDGLTWEKKVRDEPNVKRKKKTTIKTERWPSLQQK